MFDYFGEITEFLGQVVSWGNVIIEYIQNGGKIASGHLKQFSDAFSAMPSGLAALIQFILFTKLFEFIRGRSS